MVVVAVVMCVLAFFFFKQKTAYEMRISDWSSDVCSSDLAVVQTLEGVWSDLFALFSGTALEVDAEDLGWAFVNLFHRSAQRKSTSLDRATDEVRALVATADGSEIHTHELETQVERAQCAESAMLALEEMREEIGRASCRERGGQYV